MSAPERPIVVQVGVSLELAGPGRVAVDLATNLDPAEFDVRLIMVRDGPLRAQAEAAGIPVIVAGPAHTPETSRPRMGLALTRTLVSYLLRARPVIVHTHLLGIDIVGRPIAMLARVPVLVSTQHDVNPRPLPHTIYRRLTGRMIDATVACSAGVMDYCRNVLHVPEDRLFLIDNGVDVERFASVGPPRRDPMTFLTLGSLSLPKGHDTLIEAFAAVARQRPGTRLLISGEGPEEGRIRDLIERMGLGDSVSILPPTLDVPGRFAATDALVQPSRREGLPVAVLEAMAARRPVIATAVSSVAEVLEDGRLGLVVPPTDASALAAGMLAVIDDPRAAAARADLAAERVARDYSIERMAAEYGVLYRRLLASSSS